MGLLKGQMEYTRFKMGTKLTWKQQVLAQCYVCNGSQDGGKDCLGVSCPLYPSMPYRKKNQNESSGGSF